MSKQIERNYLEISSLKELKECKAISDIYSVKNVEPADFQLNRFFYKQVGKKHNWVDRLVWSEKQWIEYTSDKKVKTFVLKKDNDLVGYFELIIHEDENEVEIAYLGLLEEYQNQNLGSFLLSSAFTFTLLIKIRK